MLEENISKLSTSLWNRKKGHFLQVSSSQSATSDGSEIKHLWQFSTQPCTKTKDKHGIQKEAGTTENEHPSWIWSSCTSSKSYPMS